MKWICNWEDPKREGWLPSDPEDAELFRHALDGKIIGEPQVPPGSPLTVAELKAMHLVGVYDPQQEEEDTPAASGQ